MVDFNKNPEEDEENVPSVDEYLKNVKNPIMDAPDLPDQPAPAIPEKEAVPVDTTWEPDLSTKPAKFTTITSKTPTEEYKEMKSAGDVLKKKAVAAEKSTAEVEKEFSKKDPVSELEMLKADYEKEKKLHRDRMNKASWADSLINVANMVTAQAGGTPMIKSNLAESTAKSSEKELERKFKDYLEAKKLAGTSEKVYQLKGKAYRMLPNGKMQLIEGQTKDEDISPKDIYYKERAESERERRKYISKKFDMMKEERNELSTADRKVLGEKAILVKKLARLENNLTNEKVGPVAGRMAKAFTTLGGTEAGNIAYRAAAGRVMADYIKSISGAAVSDQERAILERVIPNTEMTPEVFRKVLNEFKSEVARSANTILDVSEISEGKKYPEMRDYFKTIEQLPKSKVEPSTQDKQAIEWLQKNPNAPQADAIRKKLQNKGVL